MSCVSLMTTLLISGLVSAPVTGTVKVWGRELSLDLAPAWTGGRQPCAGQVALLPDNLAIYLHKHLEARTMILPSNGEVIFDEGASISFVDGVSAVGDRCKGVGGSTVRFSGGGAGDRWFDASSWRQAALPSPVPHAERVPCASGSDAVQFPDSITYRAQVQRPVTVAALAVGPHVMNNERFRAFRNSSAGRSLFNVRDKFNISGVNRPCATEDCACGNDRQEVLSVICQATTCPAAPCSDSVQPAGHCCPMCGAYVRVTSATGSLDPSELLRLLHQLSGAEAGQVRWFVSRTHDRQLQTVLVDAAAERQVSRRLAETLLSKLTGTAQYRVTASVMRASGPRHAALVSGGGGGRSVAGPVLAVLCLLIAAALLVWAVRTKRVSLPSAGSLHLPPPPSQWHLADRTAALAAQLPRVRRRLASAATAPFHFARFRNSTAGSEVELGDRAEELESVQDSASVATVESSESAAAEEADQTPPAAAHPDTAGAPRKPGRSFDNPMFGNRKLDDNVPAVLLAPTSALCVTPDGKSVANPFFGVPVITVAEEAQKAASPKPGAVASFMDPTPPEDEPEDEPEEDEPAASAPAELSQPASRQAELTAPQPEVQVTAGGGDVAPGQEQPQQQEQQQDEQQLLIDVGDSD